MITKITVTGDPIEDRDGDKVWREAAVDDGEVRPIKVTIRSWLHDGHWLAVYINGSDPLYPTVVYSEDGEMLAVSAGLLGAVRG